MNVGMMLMLFLVACASIMGLFFVANQYSVPVTDTYGNVLSNQSNNTSVVVQDIAGAGLDIGTGVIIFIAMIIGVIMLVALVSMASSRGGRM